MSKIEENWNKIFEVYHILENISNNGQYTITASEIKKFWEPRLMAKFDHFQNLPDIFRKNHLSILPITRGSYVIAPFATFHDFGEKSETVNRVYIPEHLQSLRPDNIVNEAMALDCAYSCGILSDFLEDEELYPTVSGRMGSGKFDFVINTKNGNQTVRVDNSQIEIDASYEGIRYLSLFEAKNDVYDDFIIRQLYYPYRTWTSRVTKEIKSVFLVYTNGCFNLYQYRFSDPSNYNSIELVKQSNYQISASITIRDIQDILKSTPIEPEPNVPFPQADSMARIVNLITSLNKEPMSRNAITDKYAFDERQTSYYTAALKYLGLVKRNVGPNRLVTYTLSPFGKKIISLQYRDKQLEIARQILRHKVFRIILDMHLRAGQMPDRQTVIKSMKECQVNIDSEETYSRRASTVTGWVNWILSIIDE